MSIEICITAIERVAENVTMFTFTEANGGSLPRAPAGAHIRIHLPDGLERCYSLVHAPGITSHYRIAVALNPSSAGGSRYLYEKAHLSERLTIAGPFDSFSLIEDAPRSIFIAGGIGITPIWSMIQRLEHLDRPWRLHYAMRRREAGAFVEHLLKLDRVGEPRVHLAVSDDGSAGRLDIHAILNEAGPSDHVYCCGPERMLAQFRSAAAARDSATVHWEYFEAPALTAAVSESGSALGHYTLELRRSARSIAVGVGTTALDALLAAGIDVPYACRQGICGSCEISVLEGTPDHRDLVLSDEERAAGRTMMPCCSGCIGERLVLDL
jgi:ferredoxin-NADP reductase